MSSSAALSLLASATLLGGCHGLRQDNAARKDTPTLQLPSAYEVLHTSNSVALQL